MKTYDPMTEPPSAEWLDLDEAEQIDLVAAHHKQIRAKLPRPEVHAVVHVVVENQLAEGIAPARDALERLIADGLDRHEAIHAISTVLLDHMQRIVRGEATELESHERYFQELKELTADKWLRSAD